jgi:hypothetical protein
LQCIASESVRVEAAKLHALNKENSGHSVSKTTLRE